jgi:hypothetical protein
MTHRHASTTPSPHAQVYNSLIPGMLPVALLGSAVYLVSLRFLLSKWRGFSLVWPCLQGLHLLRGSIAQEKLMGEANARVRVLEAEIESLQQAQQTVITPPTITQTVDIAKSAPSKSGWVPWR